MNQPKKLSKSACAKYQQCAAGYDFHYNQGIRPIKTGSPLVFGNGIDHGLNAILLKSGDPLDAYDLECAKFALGSVVPNKNDYDGELITDKDKLLEKVREFGYSGDDVDSLAVTLLGKAQAGEELSANQCKAVDLLCRASLRAKAELMFAAYRVKVLPFITQVYNVQKASGPGFLDATVEWLEFGKAVIDHKTSGKPYAEDACDYSLELALYADEEKVDKVVYVVLLKPIKKNRIKICTDCGFKGHGTHTKCNNEVGGKRCNGEWNVTILPEAEIQIVYGEVTPRAIEVAREVQSEIQRAVDNKIFYCNFKDCNSQFGKACEYKNLKWKGDMSGFEIKPKKESK